MNLSQRDYLFFLDEIPVEITKTTVKNSKKIGFNTGKIGKIL